MIAISVGSAMFLVAVAYGSKDNCIHNHIMTEMEYEYLARIIGGGLIIFIVFVHSISPRVGVMMQDYMSTIKSGVLILTVIVGIVAASGGIHNLPPTDNFSNLFENSIYDPNALINSFFKVLFIFDGWATINYALSELKDPVKNLPGVSFSSFGVAFVLFLGTTLSYFVVVPVSQLTEGNDIISVQFFKATLGDVFGGRVVPFFIRFTIFYCSLAAFSCSMTLVYSYSRLIMETSKDGMLPPQKYFAKVSTFDSPLHALVLSGVISLCFVFIPPPGGAYDFLVVLSSYPEWIFYGLALTGLVVMRFTRPNVTRPVKAPLVGTIFFIIACICLAVVPFFPPEVMPTYNVPYWLVPTLGTTVILFFAGLYYILESQLDGIPVKDIFELADKAHAEMNKTGV
jgi:amino acid transporter